MIFIYGNFLFIAEQDNVRIERSFPIRTTMSDRDEISYSGNSFFVKNNVSERNDSTFDFDAQTTVKSTYVETQTSVKEPLESRQTARLAEQHNSLPGYSIQVDDGSIVTNYSSYDVDPRQNLQQRSEENPLLEAEEEK